MAQREIERKVIRLCPSPQVQLRIIWPPQTFLVLQKKMRLVFHENMCEWGAEGVVGVVLLGEGKLVVLEAEWLLDSG
jgi:hypothetical protein